MNDAPLRGADAVNDELEVGYDAGFETSWRKVEITGRVVMALFVVAALAGLFGQGPFSHRTARSADHGLSIDYEPITRYGTATQVTLHLSAVVDPSGGTASPSAVPPRTVPVHVFLGTGIVEPMGLQHIVPAPASASAGHGGIEYAFDLPPGEVDALVRFMVNPTAVGPIHLLARPDGGAAVAWTQVVLP